MVTISEQSVNVLADGLAAIIDKVRKEASALIAESESLPAGPEADRAAAAALGYALAVFHFHTAAQHLVSGLDNGVVPGVTVTSAVADDGLPTGMYL